VLHPEPARTCFQLINSWTLSNPKQRYAPIDIDIHCQVPDALPTSRRIHVLPQVAMPVLPLPSITHNQHRRPPRLLASQSHARNTLFSDRQAVSILSTTRHLETIQLAACQSGRLRAVEATNAYLLGLLKRTAFAMRLVEVFEPAVPVRLRVLSHRLLPAILVINPPEVDAGEVFIGRVGVA